MSELGYETRSWSFYMTSNMKSFFCFVVFEGFCLVFKLLGKNNLGGLNQKAFQGSNPSTFRINPTIRNPTMNCCLPFISNMGIFCT